MLGTCTKSPVVSEFDESSRPTANIEQDSIAPANGPASDMSTFVLLSGRMDLNYNKRTVISIWIVTPTSKGRNLNLSGIFYHFLFL